MLSSNPTPQERMLSITGQFKVLGVVGFPVEHSLSPGMHNAAIASLGLSFVYVPFLVHPDRIGLAVRSMEALGIVGLNVTIPHKTTVMPFLDEITDEAKAVGAVNTVFNQHGRLVGYNTDGIGFISPLIKGGYELLGSSAVVLGAGGSARSVVLQLLSAGCRVTIANRSLEKAKQLAVDIGQLVSGISPECVELTNFHALRKAVSNASLLVNTTSVGMSGISEDQSPLPGEMLHSNLLVYDLIYVPQQTRLLLDARNAGARVLNGVDMLVGQGAASFEIWTGIKPSIEVMKRAVMGALAPL